MSKNPKISVYIPVYNRERYIAQCIESVLAQDYENIEVIISDNCSTDGTADIIKSFLYDKRIRFYQNDSNLGMYRNSQIALNYADGDYVAYLSSDDYWDDKTYLSQAADKISKINDLVMFCGGKKVFDEQTGIFYDYSDDTEGLFDGMEIFLRGLDAWPPFEISAMVINAEIYKDIINKNNEMFAPGTDVYIFWRLCLKGKLYISRKPFLVFRNHNDNACRWKSIEDFIERILINTLVPIKTYEFLRNSNIFPKQVLDKWLVKNILLFLLGSYIWNWDKFSLLKSAYENILAEKGLAIDEFGINSLLDRLREVKLLENKIYFYSDNEEIGNEQNFLIINGVNYSILSLKKELENVGHLRFNPLIKNNLAESGINEDSINDFFDVFIYSKIFPYVPGKFKEFNLSIATGIGALEQINGNSDNSVKIAENVIDIFGSGGIIVDVLNKTPSDQVYVVFVQNAQLRYVIETIKQKRAVIDPILGYQQLRDYGYEFAVRADAVLPGEYDIITIAVKGNDAFIFDNNKKINL